MLTRSANPDILGTEGGWQMVKIGDLVLATESLEIPTLGIVTRLVNHATFAGIVSVEVWWADDGKRTLMQQQYAVALKKELDKYLAG